MRLDAVLAGHRAHEPRLQEGAPLVDQAAVAAVVILGAGVVRSDGLACARPALGLQGSAPTRQMRPMRAYTAGLCGASADRSRKKKYSLSSLRSALSGTSSAWMNEGSAGGRGQHMAGWAPRPASHLTGPGARSPLSHRELYWSVRMAVCLPSVRKMAASVPMKSMYTPALDSIYK